MQGLGLRHNAGPSALYSVDRNHIYEPERLQRVAHRYPGVTTTTDADALITNPAVDAVVIAVPPRFHLDLTLQALSAGKHVLVEKPFAHSHREAIALVRLAEQKGLKLAVDQNWRYLPLIRALRSAVASGEL